MQKTFKCLNCENEIRLTDAGSVASKGKHTDVICRRCSKFVRSPLNLTEVIIVPITLERFNKIVEKYRIYYHPMTYGRKGAQNIAFYVSTPISAITHLAKVTKIYINQPLKNLPGSELFAQPADVSDLQKVYYLEKVEPIRKIIKTDNRTVQGTLITSLEGLKKAKTISDILGRSRKISL